MDWKQIEKKWAAMARRVCADAQCGAMSDSATLDRRVDKGEVTKTAVAMKSSAVGTEIVQERISVSTH